MRFERKGTGADRGVERARWVREYRASGLGLQQFAHEHGLKAGQLHYWVYGAGRARVAEPVFREVMIPAALPRRPAWGAELALPSGTRVLLSPGTDVAWVSALVESLRRPCSP